MATSTSPVTRLSWRGRLSLFPIGDAQHKQGYALRVRADGLSISRLNGESEDKPKGQMLTTKAWAEVTATAQTRGKAAVDDAVKARAEFLEAATAEYVKANPKAKAEDMPEPKDAPKVPTLADAIAASLVAILDSGSFEFVTVDGSRKPRTEPIDVAALAATLA